MHDFFRLLVMPSEKENQDFVNKIPQIKVFLGQAKYGRSLPIYPDYNRISDNVGRAIKSVCRVKVCQQNHSKQLNNVWI